MGDNSQPDVKTQWKMFIHSPVYMEELEDERPWYKQLSNHRSLLVNVHPDNLPKVLKSKIINLANLERSEAINELIENARLKRLKPGRGRYPPLVPDEPDYPQAAWHATRLSPDFQGHQDILAHLHREFINASRQSRSTRPHALTGLAQIGKTQVALKFAAEHRSYYSHIFEVEVKSPQGIIDGFKQIAQSLKLENQSGEKMIVNGAIRPGVTEKQLIDAVKCRLQNQERVLAIFHLSNSIQWDKIKNFLPQEAKSHILLITCKAVPTLPALSLPAIPVENLTSEEGARLLLKQAGRKEEDRDWGTEIGHAKTIVELIGCFPPALVLIGHRIRSSKMTVEQYAKDFKEEKIKAILKDPLNRTSIDACWQNQFNMLKSANDVAQKLLLFCAFFAHQPIPEAFLAQEVQRLNIALQTQSTLNDAAKALLDYSFVDRQPATLNHMTSTQFTLNPLLQIWLRECSMTEQERKDMAEQVVRVVANALPDVSDPAFSSYIKHAEKCAHNIRTYKIFTKEAAELVGKLRDVKLFWGDVKVAEAYRQLHEEILNHLIPDPDQGTQEGAV
ncbi:MAG TPA: NB-ARC domain-containing protein [Ktedonobacteraceae bacterium]|nr:NB-ARC domain-containing protein [Ktedonobacteraceae bacterium]